MAAKEATVLAVRLAGVGAALEPGEQEQAKAKEDRQDNAERAVLFDARIAVDRHHEEGADQPGNRGQRQQRGAADLRLGTSSDDVAHSEADSGAALPIRTPDGWDRCVVKKHTVHDELTYFVIRNIPNPRDRSIRFSTPTRSGLPSAGETLFLKGDRMSFFSFEMFEPQQVNIERKRTKARSMVRRAAKKRRARRKRK